jgi:hypothetical protein
MRSPWSARAAAPAVLLLAASLAHGQAAFRVKGVGGAALAPDGKTLAVSVPHQATLIFYDTADDKELRRVEVDFQPSHLAFQGDRLFVAAKGSSAVHVLDASAGKERRESGKDQGAVKLPGEPVIALACHPTKGLLYAVNASNEVFAVDPDKGEAKKTKAKGQLIAVDPADGKAVYTGIQKPIEDKLVLEKGPDGKVVVSLAQANLRAVMLKYAVEGDDLTLAAANDNAAVNGSALAVSGDGQHVAMSGGGGWRSRTERKFNYAVAVFETGDMQSMQGLAETGPYPSGVAFHPALPYLAVYNRAEVALFGAKALTKKQSFKLQKAAASAWLAFGARGTKLICIGSVGAPADHECVIEFLPLTLTDQDRDALKAAYPK